MNIHDAYDTLVSVIENYAMEHLSEREAKKVDEAIDVIYDVIRKM